MRHYFAGLLVIALACGSVTAWSAEQAQPAKTPAAQPAFSSEGLSPSARLTYASILFYEARRVMVESDDRTKKQDAFRQVERELSQALKDAGQETDPRAQKLVSSQSAFMLGDLSLYVFNEREQAKAHYRDALKFFPEHDGAIEALKRLQ